MISSDPLAAQRAERAECEKANYACKTAFILFFVQSSNCKGKKSFLKTKKKTLVSFPSPSFKFVKCNNTKTGGCRQTSACHGQHRASRCVFKGGLLLASNSQIYLSELKHWHQHIHIDIHFADFFQGNRKRSTVAAWCQGRNIHI